MSLVAQALREAVCRANLDLVARGLVMETFGNVSGVDRDAGLFVIKASGVPYDELTAEHMVPVSLATGLPLESRFRPSSDTPTHHELYRAFPRCGAVAHTHSEFATAFAQARTPIACMGTTHADYFRGDVPVTRPMTREEVDTDYERHTGLVIVETFTTHQLSAEDVTAVLVANHGPFAWGHDAADAVERAAVVEYLARMECTQRIVAPGAPKPADYLINKHFSRKHGKDAYYGQK
ncbi:MAG: L-ribulose-5-phosphate 4-epimerase AraD [Acidobacteria bacterium]|nr:MAG: L-ribulose-5-phosphate 4-epimerase AraD [Acidobacteriota bacterium]